MAQHKQKKQEGYFTTTEVARMFAVTPHRIARWIKGGKLPATRDEDGFFLIPEEPVIKLAQETWGD